VPFGTTVGDQRSKFNAVEVAPLGAQTTQPAGQWCLPQLLQSDSVAQEKWLLLVENLCSVV
jgi:hypothetical protein